MGDWISFKGQTSYSLNQKEYDTDIKDNTKWLNMHSWKEGEDNGILYILLDFVYKIQGLSLLFL